MKRQFLTPSAPPSGGAFYIHVKLPKSVEFRELLVGALLELTQVENWSQFGSMSPEDAAEMWSAILNELTDEPVLPVGTFISTMILDAKPNWIVCDGHTENMADWPELMEIWPEYLKNQPAQGQFVAPALQWRTLVGQGFYDFMHFAALGDVGGEIEHVLTVDEMPSHSHSEVAAVSSVINGGLEAPAASAIPSAAVTGSAGAGMAHNNMPPFFAAAIYLVGRLLP